MPGVEPPHPTSPSEPFDKLRTRKAAYPSPRGGEGQVANPVRGEEALAVGDADYVLRPSFAALVAAEEELGPLFALVERAAAGGLTLAETAALLWHCVDARPAGLTREDVGEAIAVQGLAATTPLVRAVLSQILQGR